MMCIECKEPMTESERLQHAGQCLPCHAQVCDSDDCVSMSCFEIRWFGVLDSRQH
jgi:hypothetical protein